VIAEEHGGDSLEGPHGGEVGCDENSRRAIESALRNEINIRADGRKIGIIPTHRYRLSAGRSGVHGCRARNGDQVVME